MNAPPEPRRNLPVPLEVEVRLEGGERRREYAVNLSAGGACLHVASALPSGERIELAFLLPELAPVRVVGRVVWQSAGNPGERFLETGLQFDEVDPATAAQLREWAAQPIDRRR